MKKIFLLLAAALLYVTAIAQPVARVFAHDQREDHARPKDGLTFRPSAGSGLCSVPVPESSSQRGGVKSPSWQPNGIRVVNVGFPEQARICTDGKSGAIICWQEQYRLGGSDTDYDIYAQRVDSGGNMVWQTDGVPVCSLTNSEAWFADIVSDGAGGAIISWEEWGRDGTGYPHIYAQRLDSLGNRVWPENGITVCSLPSAYVNMCADGRNGAVMAWQDERDVGTTSDDIYAQRVDANGNILWQADGVPVCTADDLQLDPLVCVNNKGSTAITWWEDYRNRNTTGKDIYAQLLDSLGNIRWIADGISVCVRDSIQLANNPVPNNIGGAYIGWYDFLVDGKTYVQSFDSNGVKQWDSVGVFTGRYGSGGWDVLCANDDNGFIIVNLDTAQSFDVTATPLWSNGSEVFNFFPGGDYNISKDDSGDVLIVAGQTRLYSQRLTNEGLAYWGATGVTVDSVSTASDRYPKVCSDLSGGLVCAWEEFYIYAQRIYADGTPGGVEGEPTENAKGKVQKIKLWPNPFYALANIQYSLDKTQHVSLNIYNITGQRVKTLINGKQNAGIYNLTWSGTNEQGQRLSNGVYFICQKTEDITQTQKISLIR
ncbi:T9SS type A sorting domain-containing protein [candidate division TA06 bacterium]|nr:T9SS type A sorting domain-containing protein [candidate division TA06 bacterium]